MRNPHVSLTRRRSRSVRVNQACRAYTAIMQLRERCEPHTPLHAAWPIEGSALTATHRIALWHLQFNHQCGEGVQRGELQASRRLGRIAWRSRSVAHHFKQVPDHILRSVATKVGCMRLQQCQYLQPVRQRSGGRTGRRAGTCITWQLPLPPRRRCRPLRLAAFQTFSGTKVGSRELL